MNPHETLTASEFAFKFGYQKALYKTSEFYGVLCVYLRWTYPYEDFLGGEAKFRGRGMHESPYVSVYLTEYEIKVFYATWLGNVLSEKCDDTGVPDTRTLLSVITFGPYKGRNVSSLINEYVEGETFTLKRMPNKITLTYKSLQMPIEDAIYISRNLSYLVSLGSTVNARQLARLVREHGPKTKRVKRIAKELDRQEA